MPLMPPAAALPVSFNLPTILPVKIQQSATYTYNEAT